jgi:drug/metabolite transporter (DMT)-like permease
MLVGNIAGMRVFFGVHTRAANLVGAAIGIAGVTLLFWPELRAYSGANGHALGLGYALAATLCASLGNMVAARNQRQGLPILQVNGWSMLYGAVAMGGAAAVTGQHFSFDSSWGYVASLAYLALFGSVLAFGAYLTLMGRIGANRAGYSMIATPVLALLISTWLENLHWTALMWTGVSLCLLGNVLILRRKSA